MSSHKNKRSKTLPAAPTNKYKQSSGLYTKSDGQSMSQVLSTFSATEQDRFAAYRRSAFATDAASSFVAHCLVKYSDSAYQQRKKGKELGSCTTSDTMNEELTWQKSGSKVKPLSEYVAPGNASRINLIVGTIAKIYAQRLVKSARIVANEKGYSNEKKILPSHVLEAHRNRLKSGVDPGLYMQSNNYDGFGGFAVETTAVVKRKMEEALAAQDEYDKVKK